MCVTTNFPAQIAFLYFFFILGVALRLALAIYCSKLVLKPLYPVRVLLFVISCTCGLEVDIMVQGVWFWGPMSFRDQQLCILLSAPQRVQPWTCTQSFTLPDKSLNLLLILPPKSHPWIRIVCYSDSVWAEVIFKPLIQLSLMASYMMALCEFWGVLSCMPISCSDFS